MEIDFEIATILKTAANSQTALNEIYKLKKEQFKSFSLAVVSKRANLSKSYLSEVLSGKKKLNPKYVLPLSQCFKLGVLERSCLQALVELESATPSQKKAAELEVHKTRKVLALLSADQSAPHTTNTLLAFDVYASFGMFKNEPTLADLRKVFSDISVPLLELVLQELLASESIARKGEVFCYTERGFVFNAGQKTSEFVDFWKSTLLDAQNQVEKWAVKREQSSFLSYSISVRSEEYVKALDSLKKQFFEFASSVDSPDADSLIRMNLQIYPIRNRN